MKKIKSVKNKKVAVFDIDGTIFRSSLLIEVTEALISEGLFPASAKKVYAKSFTAWLNRQDSYDKYIYDVIKAFEKNIKQVRRSDYMRVGRKVIAFHQNRVYRFTRDLVKDLQKRGYFLLAISHSPRELVELFAQGLGFDKVYGRVLLSDGHGKFTGRVEHEELISDKAKILKRAVAKEGLALRGSVGVGDSEGDITLLRSVDRPIAFNPNSKLYQEARRRGWEIVVERKDVVYKI
ncbi:MAG: HAD-IB family hydrolase [Patescibacteria group bacterium]